MGKQQKIKSSNAFKFTHKKEKFSFIVVNIHLLAATPERRIKEDVNAQQDYELSNIIYKTIEFNKDKLPIYLCGDFNRNTIHKDKWVTSILKNLQEKFVYEKLDEYLEKRKINKIF